jgi:hypothetical protein
MLVSKTSVDNSKRCNVRFWSLVNIAVISVNINAPSARQSRASSAPSDLYATTISTMDTYRRAPLLMLN